MITKLFNVSAISVKYVNAIPTTVVLVPKGCGAVYTSVSGLKAHLGLCTMVRDFFYFVILTSVFKNMLLQIVDYIRLLCNCDQTQ